MNPFDALRFLVPPREAPIPDEVVMESEKLFLLAENIL